jgi:hypothetical protein
VDLLSDLEGKTVSGGRLNVYNSIQLLLNRSDLTVIPDSFNVELRLNSVKTDTLTILNSGSEAFSYTITIPEQPDWINLEQTNGTLQEGEFDEIAVTFDDNGMDTGIYQCIIVVDAGEVGNDTIPVSMLVYGDVGIGEREMAFSEVNIYPNPVSSDEMYLDITAKEKGVLNFVITDITGREVYQKEQKLSQGENHISINRLVLARGIYLYKLLLNGRYAGSGKLIRK